jgi:multiple sugar transport system permease protein
MNGPGGGRYQTFMCLHATRLCTAVRFGTGCVAVTRHRRRGDPAGGDGMRAASLLAPAFVGLVTFLGVPALLTLFIAGTDKSLTGPSFHWTGTANLRTATHDGDFHHAVTNTLLYCAYTVIPAVGIGLALALAANRVTRGRALVRLALFLPVTANLVAIAVVFSYIFNSDPNGLANAVLGWFGASPVDWLGNASTALPVVAAVGLWRLVSFVFVIYLAGLTAIPASVHEAADVDGLRGWARFRWVTWPLLGPTTIFCAVVCTILTLQTFETVAVLTGGGPLGSSTTLVYYIYQVGFTGSFRIGYASMLVVLLLAAVIGVGVAGSTLGRRARLRASRTSAVGGGVAVGGSAVGGPVEAAA